MRWRSDRPARARWVIAGVWIGAALCVAAALAGEMLASSDGYALTFGDEKAGSMSLTMAVSLPLLAAAILTLRPTDRVGWVLGTTGMLRSLSIVALAWSYHGLVASPGSLPWGGLASLVGGMALVATPIVMLPLLVAWIPDGEAAPSFRWIPKAVAILALTLPIVAVLAWPSRGPKFLTDSGPVTARDSVGDGVLTVAIVCAYGVAALGLVGLLEKWRLSAGVLRQQLKWVLFGVAAAVSTNIVAGVIPSVEIVRLLGFMVMLASVGVAVFRYRLFDIDRLIKGTILYGTLTAALLAVVGATGVLVGSVSRPGTGTSVIAASLAIAAALAVLGPVHRWAQDHLDRVFDRGSWEATHRIRAFTASSGREPPEPGSLQMLLAEVLDDPKVSLSYRLADGAHVDPWGRPAAATPDGLVVAVSVLGSGEAHVAHTPTTAGDGNRLRRVMEESVVAFEHGRVQADLGRQLAALHDSRARLIAASDTERRRIERDIHDGAQSQLVALGLALRTGQRRADPPLSDTADALIDQAVAGIQDAIAELRRFASGVMSPLLVSNGIEAAVSELAARLPGSVAVDIDLPIRPPEGIESVLWFVTCEATTNALKHAPGAAISISIVARDDELRAEVTDSGPGGATSGNGSGLRGLADRVEAVNGRFEVSSAAGAGTTVRAVIPCRVVIAEDSVMLREGLARILDDEGFEVSTVGTPDELLDCIGLQPPDVVIVDVRMPPTHTDEGIRAAIEIRRRGHATPILLFSQYIETARAIELLSSGSSGFGYLLKDRVLDVDDFVDAVRRVANGGTAIDPLIVSALVNTGHRPDRLASLSPRELDVLRLMAEGLTNTAISTRLHLARRTVETHVNGVFTKLRLVPTQDDHRRVQAVVAYLRSEP